VREYRVAAGGSVNCSVAPNDEAALGRRAAPLAGLERLDASIATDDVARVTDISCDPVVVSCCLRNDVVSPVFAFSGRPTLRRGHCVYFFDRARLLPRLPPVAMRHCTVRGLL
jgi:hypothetical protein